MRLKRSSPDGLYCKLPGLEKNAVRRTGGCGREAEREKLKKPFGVRIAVRLLTTFLCSAALRADKLQLVVLKSATVVCQVE